MRRSWPELGGSTMRKKKNVTVYSWEPPMKLIIMVENQPINGIDIKLYSKGPKE
jgi:hypothetical protein